MRKTDVIQAWATLSVVINSALLMSDKRHEAEKAASFLRETALKAVPQDSNRTATEIDERAGQAEIIAHGDYLEMSAAIMPYLLRRRVAARLYMEKPTEGGLEYLVAINKKISELLNLF